MPSRDCARAADSAERHRIGSATAPTRIKARSTERRSVAPFGLRRKGKDAGNASAHHGKSPAMVQSPDMASRALLCRHAPWAAALPSTWRIVSRTMPSLAWYDGAKLPPTASGTCPASHQSTSPSRIRHDPTTAHANTPRRAARANGAGGRSVRSTPKLASCERFGRAAAAVRSTVVERWGEASRGERAVSAGV